MIDIAKARFNSSKARGINEMEEQKVDAAILAASKKGKTEAKIQFFASVYSKKQVEAIAAYYQNEGYFTRIQTLESFWVDDPDIFVLVIDWTE